MIINYKHKLSQIWTINNQHRCETDSVIYKYICENYLGVHMFLFFLVGLAGIQEKTKNGTTMG